MGGYWQPQPGPQARAAVCPADEIFFGGARGGGKSDLLIGLNLMGAQQYGDRWNGLLIRRRYKDFAEMRLRIDAMIRDGLPAVRTGGEQQINIVEISGGGRIRLAAFDRLQKADDYQGHQYTLIGIDEGPTFPWVAQLIDKLKGCLRSPHGVPCKLFVTGNPGGPGHMAVKQRYMVDAEGYSIAPWTVIRDPVSDETRVFIPSYLQDNQILTTADPKYVNRLRSITDPILRKAWLDGDWDVFIGQAFDFDKRIHIIEPLPVPEHAPLYMTYDFGYGKPFSIGWWWVDGDGRVYRFAEWYGCSGVPDEGLRLTDSEVAEGICERETKLGIVDRSIIRLAGPDCFAKKPDYRGGGQGPATAEVFAEYGLYLKKGDPSRHLKIRQFRERMRVPKDADGRVTGLPMMVAYRHVCKDFARTIEALCVAEDDPEDVDTEQEDHVYDEACHVCMARPMKAGTARSVAEGRDVVGQGAKSGRLF